MMQHALKLCNYLHLVDVGAVNDRPRAIDNRPYGCYRGFYVFCTRLFHESSASIFDSRTKASPVTGCVNSNRLAHSI